MFPMVLRETRMKIMCQVYRPENLRFLYARMQSTIALVFLFAITVGTALSAVQSPAEYFSIWGLSPAYVQKQFGDVTERDEFSLSSTEFQLVVRILDRFQGAPNQWRQEWAGSSVAFKSSQAKECQEQCRSVRMRGHITEVIKVAGPDNVPLITNPKDLFAVQLQLDNAENVWVVVPDIPVGLPVDTNLHEKGGATVILLHVPDLAFNAGNERPILAVASRLNWWPQTPFGRIGMDYGLFASVDDGTPLKASEADAFYASLSASTRQNEIPNGPLIDNTSLVSLLDPASDWLRLHRGDQIVLHGTVRRITKVLVESARDQDRLGSDHYWEIFVFVATPLLQIGDDFQDTYPIVYCCTELPEGLPIGEQVNEPVEIAGFIFKRYRYVTRRSDRQKNGPGNGRPQESPLLIGKSPSWLPTKQPLQLPGGMTWLPVLTALALIGWIMKGFFQSRRRSRLTETLPDQIQLP